jgi:hypothetical protein
VDFFQSREEEVVYQRRFKYEVKWQLDNEHDSVVEKAWKVEPIGDSPMQVVLEKLGSCQKTLSQWSGRRFRNAERLIKKKTKALEVLQRDEDPDQREAIKKLQGEIETLMEQEDLRWKQRAKHNWYQNGDRNTPFVHAWVDHRRRINHIKAIVDEDGHRWSNKKEIPRVFIDFYQRLFSSAGTRGLHDCLESLDSRVTPEMNGALLKTFTTLEVDAALGQMHPLKSPGPDGFSACFYQKTWSTIRSEVCTAVLAFLNLGMFDPSLNTTHIVLVPKKKCPTTVTDFRPISLCNVIYKLIVKVLANRMKNILSEVISSNQNAFIPGRLITDNTIVAFEALHSMSTRIKGKKRLYGFKTRYEQGLRSGGMGFSGGDYVENRFCRTMG